MKRGLLALFVMIGLMAWGWGLDEKWPKSKEEAVLLYGEEGARLWDIWAKEPAEVVLPVEDAWISGSPWREDFIIPEPSKDQIILVDYFN